MPPEDASFEFNRQSQAHQAKMNTEQSQTFDHAQQAQRAAEQAHQAAYVRERDQRIADEQARLAQTNELQRNMLRPPNTPPPVYKEAQEIQQESTHNVDAWHLNSADKLAVDHRIANEDYVRQTLNIERKDGANEQARRAAYMKQREQQRKREQEHEQGHKR